MFRFYLPAAECRPPVLTLAGREAHHALHVLRARLGDGLNVLDGEGTEYHCEVTEITRDALILAVKRKQFTARPPFQVTLVQAIPKGKFFEAIIQKATELGVARIVPLLTERVITRIDDQRADYKQAQWQLSAIEAIKQSGMPWLPRIDAPETLPEFVARREALDLVLIGSLHDERRHPREWIEAFRRQHARNPQSMAIWIGPEGDFTATEIRAAVEAGARPISLGPYVLRVETAAIYALSMINYELTAPR